MVGRRRVVNIDEEKVTKLREERYTWTDIAEEFNVSYRTLLRWRQDYNFQDPYQTIDDNNPQDLEILDSLIIKHKHGNNYVGERMHIGLMRTTNLNVTRKQIRDSLDRVDKDGKLLRSSTTIVRRR